MVDWTGLVWTGPSPMPLYPPFPLQVPCRYYFLLPLPFIPCQPAILLLLLWSPLVVQYTFPHMHTHAPSWMMAMMAMVDEWRARVRVRIHPTPPPVTHPLFTRFNPSEWERGKGKAARGRAGGAGGGAGWLIERETRFEIRRVKHTTRPPAQIPATSPGSKGEGKGLSRRDDGRG
jgi:hypothetical protein